MKTFIPLLLIVTLLTTPLDSPTIAAVPTEDAPTSDLIVDPGVTALLVDDGLLRELLVRLVAPYTGPNGQRGKVDVFVGALPSGLDLPVPTHGRLVGSVAKETPNGPIGSAQATSTDVVMDAPGSVGDVLAFFQKELTAKGWTLPPNYSSPSPRGFVGSTNPGYAAYCGGGRFLNLNVTGRAGAPADVRLTVNGFPGPCTQAAAPMGKQMPPGYDKLPALYAPDGVVLSVMGAPGGPARWGSEAAASTDRTPAQLEDHFAAQLLKTGWARTAGGHDGPLAWSAWTVPGDGGWVGFLSVLDAGKMQRDLTIRVEQPGIAAAPTGK